MKNTYPQPTISSQNGVSPSALFYLFSGAAVLTLVLRLCNVVNDSRVLWASLVLFSVSIVLYQKVTQSRPAPRATGGEEYANSSSTPPALATAERAAAGAQPSAPDPVVLHQQSTRFMTPAEFQGEATQVLPASPSGAHLTRIGLEPVLNAHLVWLERGALPDASGRAVLIRSDIQGENLRGVILVRANLTNSQLTNALLSECNLSGATLCHSDLSHTDLRGADLRETDLRDCLLVEIDGRGADMRGAELIQANLRGANLAGADLSEAYLSGADLTGADLSGAKLDGAYLSGALLLGADLTGTSLEGIDLRRARYDMHTKWPARFEPRTRGAIMTTESSAGE